MTESLTTQFSHLHKKNTQNNLLHFGMREN